MARIDLHSHSTRSDGSLDPAALVARARERGVEVLALTDHDEVSGIADAQSAARDHGIEFVAGCELSASFEDQTIHILGLGIDPSNAALKDGLESIRAGRGERAQRMADALADAGIHGALEGARRHVRNPRLVSRTHFARWLVEAGRARDVHDVFARYLTPGKPGYVRHVWATVTEVVGWIRGAGGRAVVAHPGRYRMDEVAMNRLLATFRGAGGEAIEIISPSHSAVQVARFAGCARVHDLLGSVGSDFHAPRESRLDLGELSPLPVGLAPIWSRF